MVVNNKGGGIFSFLPISKSVQPGTFATLWSTQHEVSLVNLCRAHRYIQLLTFQVLSPNYICKNKSLEIPNILFLLNPFDNFVFSWWRRVKKGFLSCCCLDSWLYFLALDKRSLVYVKVWAMFDKWGEQSGWECGCFFPSPQDKPHACEHKARAWGCTPICGGEPIKLCCGGGRKHWRQCEIPSVYAKFCLLGSRTGISYSINVFACKWQQELWRSQADFKIRVLPL